MITKKSQVSTFNILSITYQIFVLLAILFLLFNTFLKSDKIAYVDSAKIFNQYKGAEMARKSYQQKTKIWQSNIDTLTDDVKKSIAYYEQSLAKMSPKEQVLAKELISNKQRRLADYQRGIQENAKQEDSKLMQSVVIQINTFLAKYGKKHNYRLILIANQSGTIAYARDGLDITSEVIEELNTDYFENEK